MKDGNKTMNIQLVAGVATLLLLSCAIEPRGNGRQANEMPMYRGIDKTSEMIEADNLFIKNVTKEIDRDSASRHYSSIGFKLLNGNDYSTAIKRFNQAWLLDSTNYEVYWGFAGYTRYTKGPESEANTYLKKAYNLNSGNCRLAIQYLTSIYFLKNAGVDPNIIEVKSILNNIIEMNCEDFETNKKMVACSFGIQKDYKVTCEEIE